MTDEEDEMAIAQSTIEKIKLSLRIATPVFDAELNDLAEAALLDLGIAGVNGEDFDLDNPLVLRAVTTFCKMHFGEPDEYDRLKASYDEQKAQMASATGFTTWPEGV